jgi:hypothetical protein
MPQLSPPQTNNKQGACLLHTKMQGFTTKVPKISFALGNGLAWINTGPL